MQRSVVVALLLAFAATATGREVAITIDDLPRGGDTQTQRSLEAVRAMTQKLLRPFREQRIPVTGFVNEGRAVDFGADGLREVLELWLDAGAELGNHSHSHLNINNVPLAELTADIARGETLVRAALEARGSTLRYFRHPFLFTGPTPEIKAGLQAFLDERGYVVASFEAASRALAGREFPQILLLHANELNADLMPELLAMFRSRGYTFVTLEQALADDVYRLPEDYVGRGGFSWIHRWTRTKGLPINAEPEPPAWVNEAWDNR